ncbi:MAG: chemotaxis protein CheX [Brevundimonas sp.]|jgi:chemotaxis protein CheX|uniref:STAS domain-containing protein n=1 Tax=Brevundimonas albigilva TaxID=1312364 RepID=A0ABY4SMC3_9CAUL|nr:MULTISPECIES: STAS domain-containing protein [Brevundimonas]PZU60004.1 MAG: chemotaxis protein CheX [Brevundimonas sp.]URI16062.1 STAS domain-containing protein [Brevundimonas albigilva]
MTASLTLAPVLDLNAAEPLKAELMARRGADLTIDGASVDRLGGLCLQVLLSARRTWQADGVNLRLGSVSQSFADQWAAFGAPAFNTEGGLA